MFNPSNKESGIVRVVKQEKNLTYLSEGAEYEYYNDNGSVRFYGERGGTFERLVMLSIFQRQGRLILEVIK